jgi:predicted transposase/invertase (TIGR01784 family)
MVFAHYLNPKNDYAFKRIFGSERNKDILIHFLNDMLQFKDGGPVRDVTFLKTTLDPETAAYKTSIVDILCKDDKGHQYIVEMQVAKERGFAKRAQYYAAKAYGAQLEAGGAYHDLKEIVFLAITDFVMFPDKPAYKSDHVILDLATHDCDLKGFSFTFMELPKFKLSLDQLKTNIEKWAYFFQHAHEIQDTGAAVMAEPVFQKAFKELSRLTWNTQELQTYDHRESSDLVYQDTIETSFEDGKELGLHLGMQEGKELGMQEGKELGIQEGKELGIQEGKELGMQEGKELGMRDGKELGQQEIAKKMHAKGMNLEAIADLTGIPSDLLLKIL